jgi:hypothetical protein|tara:strand:- start:1910 stop:2080 length:171 start_codon:yes stop_codon:yes gene_type:complete
MGTISSLGNITKLILELKKVWDNIVSKTIKRNDEKKRKGVLEGEKDPTDISRDILK